MNKPIDRAVADEAGDGIFHVAVAREHDDEVGKLILDIGDDAARWVLQRLRIEHQNADLAGNQQIANLFGGGRMPKPPRAAERFTQGLQKRRIAREDDELDDIAREVEPESAASVRVVLTR